MTVPGAKAVSASASTSSPLGSVAPRGLTSVREWSTIDLSYPVMANLNITRNGVSADTEVNLDYSSSDVDVKRIAVELVRSGGVPGMHVRDLPGDAFASYVVDRFDTPEGGEHLPFIGLVAAALARAVQGFLARGERRDAMLSLSAMSTMG